MAQGKPKRYSDEHLKLLEAGVVVYPGDKATIDNMRSQGVWKDGPVVTWEQFWEVSDKDSVDPAANLRDKRPRLEGDPFSQPLSIEERRMVDPTWAYPGHVRLGALGPVTPGDPRPVPTPTSPNMDAEYTGLLSPAPQPYRDESAGLGVDTGYVPGMRRSISPQGTRANVDDSFDWQVRGVDPNKPWSGEMSAAERRRDELIALQKIQAKRDRQIAEAMANRQPAAPADPRQFQPFLPGEDMGLVDPNQAYPGSVRLGAPGPLTPGQKRKTVVTRVDDPAVADKEVTTIEDQYPVPTGQDDPRVGSGELGMAQIEADTAQLLKRREQGQTVPQEDAIRKALADYANLAASKIGIDRATGQKISDLPQIPETLREDEQIGLVAPPPDPRFQPFLPGTVLPEDPSWTSEAPGSNVPALHPAVLARRAEQERIARERAGEFSSAFTPPTAAPVETTPERINPVSLKERYPTVEDYIAQIEENKAARVEGREAENRSGIPLTLGGLDASSFGLDATGMIDEALKGAEEGADVEEVLGDEGAGLLSFEEKHAPNFGVEPEDTRLPPQLRKDETKPDPEKSEVGGQDVRDAPPAVRAELERQWGKWAYNPKERREKFMSQLNAIYKKGAWLDAIAALTGGRSRSAQYIERAVGKLEAMTKFDQEERVYNIWRDVYFDKDGNYNAPRSKREAAELARRLGASPAETKAIYGWAEEGEDLQQWWRPADNERGYEVTQTSGKKEAPDKGSGAEWQQGSVPTTLSAPSGSKNRIYWTNGEDEVLLYEGVTPDSLGYTGEWNEGRKDATESAIRGGKPEIDFIENVYANNGYGEAGKAAAVEALVARMRVDPGIYGLIGEFKDESHRASAVRMVDNWIREYEARGRKSYSSQGQADATTGAALPDTETREEYEAKVRKKHPNASEEDIQATVAAKYG